MLTKQGVDLLRTLQEKKRRFDEDERLRMSSLAQTWASERLEQLKQECGEVRMDSIIEIFVLQEGQQMDPFEELKLGAFGRLLGVDFSKVQITRSVRSPGDCYSLNLRLDYLLHLLEQSA